MESKRSINRESNFSERGPSSNICLPLSHVTHRYCTWRMHHPRNDGTTKGRHIPGVGTVGHRVHLLYRMRLLSRMRVPLVYEHAYVYIIYTNTYTTLSCSGPIETKWKLSMQSTALGPHQHTWRGKDQQTHGEGACLALEELFPLGFHWAATA